MIFNSSKHFTGTFHMYDLMVGFALETDNGLENAKAKLKSKNMDMIVLNSLADKGAGFGTIFRAVGPLTSTTCAPWRAASRAIAYPILPVEKLPIYRTGSMRSRAVDTR